MVTTSTPIKAESRDLNFYYNGGHKALKGITMPLYEKKITALIGPSGCGKSTFLRCFNRMHDLYPCLLYTSPSPRDATLSRMPSSA